MSKIKRNCFLLIILSLFFVMACEIGLGKAVDTEPPKLEIQTPQPDAVIRGAYKIGGTWADDGTIESVIVTLKRTDGNGNILSFPANITESKNENPNTWTCIINPTDENAKILDGNYIAQVDITDTGKHTTTKTVQFTIDNTAPIIVLQRPSTKSDALQPDSYGQKFTLEGQAADDNGVSQIELKVYADKDCKTLVHTIPLSNVPNSINLDVAEFKENQESVYSKIYGTMQKDGEKQFYCKIAAYDGAAYYPTDRTQTAEDLKGNSTEIYYLYEDIATTILSTTKITEVYHILSGVYNLNTDTAREISNATADTIKDNLAKNAVHTGSFSLNPENNPTFTVSGKDAFEKDAQGNINFSSGKYDITNGSQVVTEITPGLDNIPLNGDSLKIYFIECDLKGNVLTGAKKIYPKTEVKKSGNTYKFTVPISKSEGVTIGKNYLFGADGTDEKGNSVVSGAAAGYGFHCSTNGEAPGLTITQPQESSVTLCRDKKLDIKGFTTVEIGVPQITIYDNGKLVKTVVFTESQATEDPETKKLIYNFDAQIDFSQTQESAYHEIEIISECEKVKTVRTKTISYDFYPPQISIQSVLPVVEKDGKKCLNGKVKVTFSLTDDFSFIDSTENKPYYELYQDGIAKTEKVFFTSTNSNITETSEIDTAQLDDNKEVEIKVVAYDKAGNKEEYSNKNYFIDQSTDRPKAEPKSKIKLGLYGKENVNNETDNSENYNKIPAGSSVSFTISDDDGIESIKLVEKVSESDTDEKIYEQNGSTMIPFSFNLPETPGFYDYTFTVKDIITPSGENNIYKTEFTIKATAPAPKIEISSKDVDAIEDAEKEDGYIKKGGSFINTISIQSTEKPFTLYRKEESSDTEYVELKYEPKEETDSSAKYEITESPTKTTSYSYYVKDCNGIQSNTVTAECKVDNTPPEITYVLPGKGDTKMSSYTFTGTAKDEESKVQKVEITLSNKDNETSKKTVTANGTSSWFYQIDFNSNESNEWKDIFGNNEGEKLITFKATDKAGNVFEKPDTFVYDKANPTIKIEQSSVREFMPQSGLTVTATANDSYKLQNIKVIQNYKDNSGKATETTITIPTSEKEKIIKQQIPFDSDGKKITPADGIYTYSFVAKDSVGNTAETEKFSVKYDNTPPEITIKNPNNKIGEDAINSESYKFEGTVKEENLYGIYYQILQKGSPTPEQPKFNNTENWKEISASGNSWSFYESFKEGTQVGADKLCEGSYDLYIYAIDKAENVSTECKTTFDVDMNPPQITKNLKAATEAGKITNINASVIYFNSDLTLEVTATDTYKMSDTPVKVIVKTDNNNTEIQKTSEEESGKIIYNIEKTKFAENKRATVSITAKDAVGKSTTEKYIVCLDESSPQIKIDSPAQNENISTASKRLKGNVTDNASGVKADSVKYRLTRKYNGQTEEEEVHSERIGLIGESFEINDFNLFKNDETAETAKEGTFTLYIDASDNLEQPAEQQKVIFFYDKGSPQLKVDDIATPTNKDIAISGKAFDTNEIENVTIYIDDKERWKKTFADRPTSEPSENNYNATFFTGEDKSAAKFEDSENAEKSSYLEDGEHTIKITAKDIAGNEKQIVKTITVDTVAPSFSFDTLPNSDYEETVDSMQRKWYNKNFISLKGTVADDSKTDVKTSGIKSVQYSINKDASETEPTWSDLNISQGKWNGTITGLKQGLNTVYLKIEDNAGNYTVNVCTSFYVDSEAPNSCEVLSVDSFESTEENKITTEYEKLTNGTSEITVIIKAKDDENEKESEGTFTGLPDNAVTITKIGTTTVNISSEKTENGNFKLTIPKVTERSYTSGIVKAKIKDNAKNESSEFELFTIKLDNIYPKAKINTPLDADSQTKDIEINQTITLSGTVSDNNGIENLVIQYAEVDGTNWMSITEKDQNASIKIQDTQWTLSLDSTKFQDNTSTQKEIKLRAVATDKAGNTGNSGANNSQSESAYDNKNEITVTIDQNTDRPKIGFNNITLGDSMSSAESGHIWLKNTTILYGTIEDDDGIDSMQISNDNITWKDVTLNNTKTSWNFDIKNFFNDDENRANGKHSIYFKVTDNSEKTFTSNENSGLESVYLADGKNKYGSQAKPNSILYLQIDTMPPQVILNGARIGTSGDFKTDYTNMTLGGSDRTIQFKLTATDKNGIKGLTGIADFGGIKTLDCPIVTAYTTDDKVTSIGAENADYYTVDFTVDLTSDEKEKVIDEKDGRINLKFTGEDNAGNSSVQTTILNFDYKKPQVSINSPTDSNYVSGNITAYGTIDSVAAMYYALSPSDTIRPAEFGTIESGNLTQPATQSDDNSHSVTTWEGFDPDTLEKKNGTINIIPKYTQIRGNGVQWFVYFDNGTTTDLATHDIDFKKYLINYKITTENDISNKSFKTIVKMYLWVKATDEAGNITEKSFPILVDPQGDAPQVTISYPAKDGEILGGAVTLLGTATDTFGSQIGIKNVWVQIDSNYNIENKNFTIEKDDIEKWFTDGLNVYTDIKNTPKQVKTLAEITGNASAYYIQAVVSGSSWSLKINTKGTFSPAEGHKQNVAYRVYAQDNDGNLSKVQQQYCVFDADNPVFSDFYLRQYSDNANGTGQITASRLYEDDMWIKGDWWLCGTVSDTQGISSLTINGNSQTVNGNPDEKEDFKYLISANNSSAEAKKIEITATDNATHPATKKCSINLDNTPPDLSDVTIPKNEIKNTNGFFTFSLTVKEDAVGGTAQSGFKYLAFYFERNGNVYDIMRSKTDSDNAITANDLVKEDGLFWKGISVTRNADSLSMLELSAADKNIHTGGLCKIGGTVYMITNANGRTVELNGSPEVTHTTAYFALANVINNNIESGNGTKSEAEDRYGYFENISNDDGDHIVESVQKTGTTWKCEANINSRNIPDGPITLHCTAFDAAGNFTNKSFTDLKVANNAPRLASLKVWTDFNGNGNEDENEFDVKYYRKKTVTIDNKPTVKSQDLTTDLIVSGNDKDSDEGGSAFMTVKAETKLIPELVGGNGNLYYTYRIKNDKNSDWQNVTKSKDWNSTGNDDGIDDEADKNGYYVTDNEGTGYIKGTVYDGKVEGKNPIIITTEMLENLNNNSVNDNPTWFEYTIYDSTEGCSSWDNENDYTNGRLSAKFRVALNVQYNDEVAPNVAIHPFYWNSKADNSVVWDETTKKPLGHIELENDLSDEIKNFSVDGTALGDDPKVSGKIKIEGYAFDNIKLKELYVQFDGFNQINRTNAAATYSNGTWTIEPGNSSWNFTAEDVFVNAEGHLVYWMLTVDTATVTDTVGLDKTVKVIAKDERGDMKSATDNTNAEAVKIGVWKDVKKDKSALQLFYTDEECSQKVNSLTTDNTVVYFREKPAYQMDIVPYVTGVKTSLSDLSRKTPSMYDRTALGHYPVRVVTKNQSGTEVNEAETITFEGFNLGSSSAAVSASDLTNLTKKDGGYVYDLEVNRIPAINNLNNNNAKGSYTATINNDSSYDDKINYAYNRQPNNVNNNLLTDDIIFDVWEFNSAAAIPISGKIEQPVMKIRPTDGKIGFAFVNGPLYFSMGGSETSQNYSYQYWMGSYDFFTSVGFTYDEAGNSWGVAAGGDINDHQADKFLLMSSKWGIGKKDKEGSYSGVNSKRLESIAMKGTKANTTGTTIYFDKQRIKSPSLASSVHGENTNLYLAYYDAMNDELRFKAGNPDDLNLNKRKNRVYKIKKADNGGAGGFSGVWVNRTSEYTINNGDVVQICNEEGTLLDNKIYKLEGYYDIKENDDVAFRVVDGSGTTQKPFPGFENENNYTQTGSDSEKTAIRTPLENKPMYVKIYSMEESPEPFDDYEITKEPYPYRNATVSIIAGNGTDYGAGEYVSIGVIPGSSADNDVVVAVWYDATRRKLLYSYTTTPLDNTRGTTDRNGWSQPVEVFSGKDCENAGEYCKIAVDKKGGVHIAAYDPINLDLCYAYSSSYNAGNAGFKTCVVDSNGVVGSNLTLDVALVNGNPVPYIGYYATSCIKPKYAKLCVPITESDIDGSKNDEVTGKWKISVIPTSCVVEMQSNQHNDINIGVWKDTNGNQKKSETGTSEAHNTYDSYNSVSYGNIYGNGTENPVLGYAVKNGSIGDTIETAQMK